MNVIVLFTSSVQGLNLDQNGLYQYVCREKHFNYLKMQLGAPGLPLPFSLWDSAFLTVFVLLPFSYLKLCFCSLTCNERFGTVYHVSDERGKA